MKYSQFQLVVTALAITLSGMLMAGCRTPVPKANQQAQGTGGKEAGSPFLQPGDYSKRLEVAICEVLNQHRFAVPWTVFRDADSSIWFVAERFNTVDCFERAHVHVLPDETVTAKITAFQLGPSDWAVLGTRFANHDPESQLMAEEITEKLSAGCQAAR